MVFVQYSISLSWIWIMSDNTTASYCCPQSFFNSSRLSYCMFCFVVFCFPPRQVFQYAMMSPLNKSMQVNVWCASIDHDNIHHTYKNQQSSLVILLTTGYDQHVNIHMQFTLMCSTFDANKHWQSITQGGRTVHTSVVEQGDRYSVSEAWKKHRQTKDMVRSNVVVTKHKQHTPEQESSVKSPWTCSTAPCLYECWRTEKGRANGGEIM